MLPEQFARLGYQQIELRRTAENHLYLVGRLNGRRRSILVDSGWSFTTVSPNAARELPTPQHAGTNEPPSLFIAVLRLGRVSLTNQPARVERMTFDGEPASFEVVLGCDFLRRNHAVVDCLNRRLYVRGHALPEPEQSTLEELLRGGGFSAVTLTLKQPLGITCLARVNGHPVELLVDTGAVWSSLDLRQIEQLGLRALPTLAKIGGVGTTCARGVAVGEAKSFALGDVPVKDANFAIMNLGDWGLATPGKKLSEVGGILGGPELVVNGALIDCHRLKLWVKPADARK